jgi:hypothetical protein
MLQLKGKLKLKGSEQAVSERFRKREFVVTDDSSQYPQYISFQLTQDKCSLLDNVNVGDEITVWFNLRGREWKSPQGEIKYFNSLEAWKIDSQSTTQEPPSFNDASMPELNSMNGATDDLPF